MIDRRLLRGSSWFCDSYFCRSAYRDSYLPGEHHAYVGFRVVCLPQAGHTIRLEGQVDG